MTADRLVTPVPLSRQHLWHQPPDALQIGAEAGRLALARRLVRQAQQIGGVDRRQQRRAVLQREVALASMRERDLAPRERKPLSAFVFCGAWGRPSPMVEPGG